MDAAVADATGIAMPDDALDCTSRWGTRLGKNNKWEAARLHETQWSAQDNATCKIHFDPYNGQISQVCFCNRVYRDGLGRIKCRGASIYCRKVVDEYKVKLLVHQPYLHATQDVIEGFKGRWYISPEGFCTGS
jgi:hypothetical protein